MSGETAGLVNSPDPTLIDQRGAMPPRSNEQATGPALLVSGLLTPPGPPVADRQFMALSPAIRVSWAAQPPEGPLALPKIPGRMPSSVPAERNEHEEAIVAPMPEPADQEVAFVPEGAGVIAEGLTAGLAALERALKSLVEPETLSAGRGAVLTHWLGVSLWGLAAILAAVVAHGQRTRTARATGLATARLDEEMP